jgi:hypothetical protein
MIYGWIGRKTAYNDNILGMEFVMDFPIVANPTRRISRANGSYGSNNTMAKRTRTKGQIMRKLKIGQH